LIFLNIKILFFVKRKFKIHLDFGLKKERSKFLVKNFSNYFYLKLETPPETMNLITSELFIAGHRMEIGLLM